MTDQKQPSHSLLQAPLTVVNVGLEGFAQDLQHHGAPVLHVDWAPPARGDARLADLLSKMGS